MKILIITATRGDSPWFDSTIESVAMLRRQGVPLVWVVIGPIDSIEGYRNRVTVDRVIAERNKGLYAALNQAISDMADTYWTHFTYINDDDGLMPGFIDLCRFASTGHGDVYYGNIDYVDMHGATIGSVSIARYPADCLPLLSKGIAPFSQQGMLMSRTLLERIGLFDLRFSHVGDAYLWVRCFEFGARFCYVPTTCAFYRIRPGQLSNAVELMHDQNQLVTKHAAEIRPIKFSSIALALFRFSNFLNVLRRVSRIGLRSSRSMFKSGALVRKGGGSI